MGSEVATASIRLMSVSCAAVGGTKSRNSGDLCTCYTCENSMMRLSRETGWPPFMAELSSGKRMLGVPSSPSSESPSSPPAYAATEAL